MTIQQQYQQTKVLAGPQNSMPVIAGVEITTDEAGRFNLNALHRASGAGDHKAPNQWLRTKQAKELISELANQTANSQSGHEVLKVINGGVAPGTFAHELLAISYASWISPAFHLQVNQVFLDYRTGKLTPVPQQLTTIEILQIAMQAEQDRLRLLTVNQELEQKIRD